MASRGVLRAATLSLSVTRAGLGLEGEFELSMQLMATYFNWLRFSCAACLPLRLLIVLNVNYRIQKMCAHPRGEQRQRRMRDQRAVETR